MDSCLRDDLRTLHRTESDKCPESTCGTQVSRFAWGSDPNYPKSVRRRSQMKPNTSATRHIAIYLRVSSKAQDHRSQEPDLQRWVDAFANGANVCWYKDSDSGRNMLRPAWQQLEANMHSGKVSKLVVWRVDRLGRTASGLTTLFETLHRLGVGFESLRDRIDLETPAGRLMANVLASVAVYENEVRSERIRAGQAAAKRLGKKWGGSKRGVRKKVSSDKERVIRQLKLDGIPVARIARTVGLSRTTIYDVLRSVRHMQSS